MPSSLLRILLLTSACASLLVPSLSRAQSVPGLINYQGRVVVGSTNFTGTGQFRFALVNAGGTTTYWSNDGTSTNGSQPTSAVSLTVSSGLYALALGDTTLTNMTTIPATVFTNNTAVYLRVWFNDGTNGSQLLSPDERITSVGYAMMAAGVPANSITAAQIAGGAVGTVQLAGGAVTAADIASGTITGTQIASGAVGATQLAAGSVGSMQLASNLTAGGTFTIGSVLALPTTTSSTSGLVTLGGNPFLHAFGTANVFAGVNAGNFIMTGIDNAAVGAQALLHDTSGGADAALGFEALYQNTTGSANTAVGAYAVAANTTGNNETGVGEGALTNNTAGSSNTALGSFAMAYSSSGSQNTAVGANALEGPFAGGTASQNTALGYDALLADSTGGSNTAAGYDAMFNNTTGYDNTAVGDDAMLNNVSGYYNTALGYNALEGGTGSGVGTYFQDTALGYNVLAAVTSGANNVGIGYNALAADTTGNSNVASGTNAMAATTTGGGNVASGYGALSSNTSGGTNVGIGQNALFGNTTGGSNTALGANAGSSLTFGSNNIDIANVGTAGESNTIRVGAQVGTTSVQNATFIAGISGTAVTGSPVIITSSGQLGIAASSERFKDDVQDMSNASDALLALRPVSFRYKPEVDPQGQAQFGLIAEEVEKIDPSLVVHQADGKPFTVRYEAVNAMLLNEFLKEHRHAQDVETSLREEHRHAQDLEQRLTDLEARDKAREERLAALEHLLPPVPAPAADK